MTREQLARVLSQQDQGVLDSELDKLQERELEVFSILAQGYSSNQIHSQFGIDQRQLAALKQGIQKKLGLKNEIQLLRLAAKYRPSA